MLAATALLASVGAAGATLAVSSVASAHSDKSSVDCSGLTVKATQYDGNVANTWTATVNGVTQSGTFGASFQQTFPFNAQGDNSWSYAIDDNVPGGSWYFTNSGTTEGCDGPAPHKVWICHVPPGNPANAQALEVDENGWNGHSNHDGDFLIDGPNDSDCPPPPPDQCPDGSNPGDANGDGSVNEADCNYTPPTEVDVPGSPPYEDPCGINNIHWTTPPVDTEYIDWENPDGAEFGAPWIATLKGDNVVWSDGTTEPKEYYLPRDSNEQCPVPFEASGSGTVCGVEGSGSITGNEPIDFVALYIVYGGDGDEVPVPVNNDGSFTFTAREYRSEYTFVFNAEADGESSSGSFTISQGDDCNPEPPVDVCPNLDGDQATVPDGYELDDNGNCVEVTTPTEPTVPPTEPTTPTVPPTQPTTPPTEPTTPPTQPTVPPTTDITTPPVPPTTQPAPPTTLPDGSLPRTGDSTGSTLGLAALLFGAGTALLFVRRRRTSVS